jgi:hypothetical protein
MRTRIWRLSGAPFLLLLSGLGLCSATALGQTAKQCMDAASLWMPSDTGDEKLMVKKWKNPIAYDLVSNGHDEAAASIENVLKFLARESGLKVTPVAADAAPDLLIGVVPDISTAAPGMRELVQSYFQEAFENVGINQHVDMNALEFEAKYRIAVPRCAGDSVTFKGEILRAFTLVQEDEDQQCISIGLGQLFGLTNIRRYYTAHGRNVPAEVMALGLQRLYNEAIRPGMNQAEAKRALGKICQPTPPGRRAEGSFAAGEVIAWNKGGMQ